MKFNGGTLIASKAVKLHGFIKRKFNEFGFTDVTVTDKDNDGLKMLIREMKPRILFIGCQFYRCVTPFRVFELHETFPKLNIAAVSIWDFPDDLAMYFKVNGARSYVNFYEGEEEFNKGMNEIVEGREYISPGVQHSFAIRNINPSTPEKITNQKYEVILLVCNGYSENEVAETMGISRRTVGKYKKEMDLGCSLSNQSYLYKWHGRNRPRETRLSSYSFRERIMQHT
jgi:DNA-binding NarL/FixJ family response regulator